MRALPQYSILKANNKPRYIKMLAKYIWSWKFSYVNDWTWKIHGQSKNMSDQCFISVAPLQFLTSQIGYQVTTRIADINHQYVKATFPHTVQAFCSIEITWSLQDSEDSGSKIQDQTTKYVLSLFWWTLYINGPHREYLCRSRIRNKVPVTLYYACVLYLCRYKYG